MSSRSPTAFLRKSNFNDTISSNNTHLSFSNEEGSIENNKCRMQYDNNNNNNNVNSTGAVFNVQIAKRRIARIAFTEDWLVIVSETGSAMTLRIKSTRITRSATEYNTENKNQKSTTVMKQTPSSSK